MRLRGAHFLLAAALAGSAALVYSHVSQLSFIGDEWQLALGRGGWGPDSFLSPFNENLIAGLAFVYKIGFAAFGMGSALPFYLVSIALSLLSGVLLFIYLRRRVGGWAAALGAALVLFLGAAYEDFLWAFQMGFFASVAAGLAALIALDREDRWGDATACGMLLASLAFGSVGLAFVAAAIADLCFGRRPRARRAYVALLPLAVYAVWWLGWGQSAGGQVSLETALRTPRYVFEAAAGGTASLLGGEAFGANGHPAVIAQLPTAILAIAAGLRLARQLPVSRGTAVALALALSYWVLIGLDRTPGGSFALDSRYQYPSAVFLLLIAAELLRGVQPPRLVGAALTLVAAGAVVGGISLMDSHFSQWKGYSDQIRLEVTVLEIARPDVRPGRQAAFPPSVLSTAGAYFAASDRFGSPAYGETGLLARPGADRRQADRQLVDALGIALEPGGPTAVPRGCRRVPAGSRGLTALRAGSYTLFSLARAPARLRLGRFADAPSVGLGLIPPGAKRSLALPEDASPRDWQLEALGRPLRLCAVRPGPRYP